MKKHITNIYGPFAEKRLRSVQERLVDAALSLGFYEMGINVRPKKAQSGDEVSKWVDGIIAPIESGDLVFLQLPSGNGAEFDQHLALKCKAYRASLVTVFHDMGLLGVRSEDRVIYRYICSFSDAVIVPRRIDIPRVRSLGVADEIISMDLPAPGGEKGSSEELSELAAGGFFERKLLLDAVGRVYGPIDLLEQRERSLDPEEIHVAFALYDKKGTYSMWVGATMQSILEHTSSPVCFHILHDDTLNYKNRIRLIRTGLGGKSRVEFHRIDPARWDRQKERMGRYTVATMFRIMLPEILPKLNRVIYLDADILVTRDLKELWDTDIADACLGVVQDHPTLNGMGQPYPVAKGEVGVQDYFNSGVLLMNLEAIRQKGSMLEAVMEYLTNNPESDLPDQDALNVIYSKSTYILDKEWNLFDTSIWTDPHIPLGKCVYHFAGSTLILYTLSQLYKAYFETILRTPWGTSEDEKQAYICFRRLEGRARNLEEAIVACGKKKKHVIYGDYSRALENMIKILPLRDGDYRLQGDSIPKGYKDGYFRSFEEFEREKDQCVVFVSPSADGGKGISRLETLGFKREKDYFVIPVLLDPCRGGYL